MKLIYSTLGYELFYRTYRGTPFLLFRCHSTNEVFAESNTFARLIGFLNFEELSKFEPIKEKLISLKQTVLKTIVIEGTEVSMILDEAFFKGMVDFKDGTGTEYTV